MIVQPHRTRALAFRAALVTLAVALVPLVMAPAATATATATVNGYVGNWTQAQPTSSPAPRAFASMAFDQVRGGGGILGSSWGSWQAVTPMRSPGREAFVGKTAQGREEVGLP